MKPQWINLLVGLLGLLAIFGVPSVAMADDDEVELKAKLRGFNEVPAVSTEASGRFKGEISKDGSSMMYTLRYSGLEDNVRQAHIHFAQSDVNGGIVVFLCQTADFHDPTGLAPTCPQSGTVTGTLTAANMTGSAAGQGIAAGEFDELVRAIRAGVAYANVHSDKFPGGEIRGQIRAHD